MNFQFKLEGKQFFRLYLTAFILYVIPMIAVQILAMRMKTDPKNITNILVFFGVYIAMILSMLILTTPILKKFITNTSFEDISFDYTAKIGRYVWLNISNMFLSVITLGIYFPWFIKKIEKYIVQNISYKDNSFDFNGKGLRLLGLLLATLIVPMIIWVALLMILPKEIQPKLYFKVISTAILCLLSIPYTYYLYKWMINLSYKQFNIRWNTSAVASIGTILRELFLTIVTCGIYGPIALGKLFIYFINRTTISQNGSPIYMLNAKLVNSEVFKVTWKQILLTIITIGIYGAWAYCKMTKLYVNSVTIKNAG